MPFPLATVLTAAPGLISAAADVIRIIKERKKNTELPPEEDKTKELVELIEQQAMVIEELAVNNRNMALAVRNNRFLSAISTVIAIIALTVAIFN
jgi:ribosomal protein L4